MRWYYIGAIWFVLSVIVGLIFGRILARISAQYEEPDDV